MTEVADIYPDVSLNKYCFCWRASQIWCRTILSICSFFVRIRLNNQ